MPPQPPTVTRRRVLLGAACSPLLMVAAACTGDDPPAEPVLDPDREALQGAYEIEVALRSSLSRWASPPSDAMNEAERVIARHLQVLGASLGVPVTSNSPTVSSSPSGPAETTDGIRRSIDAAADAHSRALRTSSAEISPLLASVAASDAALAASLRGIDS